MKINLILPSVTSLGMINDGQNVQGDELVGRLWAKNLLSFPRCLGRFLIGREWGSSLLHVSGKIDHIMVQKHKR